MTLSRAAATRLKLKQLIMESELPQGVFGEAVFGCDQTTICGYLAGAKIPRTRQNQIAKIVKVTTADGQVVVISACQFNQRWNFLLNTRKKNARIA